MNEQNDQNGSSSGGASMTKAQKLAVLLVLLGPESAAQILKHLEPTEVELVSNEMAKLNLISHRLQEQVLDEFTEVAFQAGTAVRGGIGYVQQTLERALGLYKATEVINRVSPKQAPFEAMQRIVEMDSRQIYNLLRDEQPQTIALVVSYLTPDKASQVIALLPSTPREMVIERLAGLVPTPVEVVEKVAGVLTAKLGANHIRALNQTGGIKNAAAVLNALDKGISKSVLISLEERNPELSQAIRQKMFTFDDLVHLDSSALQKILREVDMRDLAIALKDAGEAVTQGLLSCISRRAADTVREEMGFLGPVKAREIENARLRIIDVARRLEGEGEFDLSEAQEVEHEALV